MVAAGLREGIEHLGHDLFGYAVGLSADGNTMAVSAYDERQFRAGDQRRAWIAERRGSGAIYVFARTGTTWAQTAYLKAHNAENGDSLGYDMAISQDGNTIAGGAGDEDCLAAGINPPGCDNDYQDRYLHRRGLRFRAQGGKWTRAGVHQSVAPG